jgi:TRAP-type C4-dicarboxylate transport system substrate-binding protein
MKPIQFKRLAAVALSASVAWAAQAADLRFTSYLPETHFGTKLIVQPLIKKIDEYTQGSVKVTNFPGGQLANAPGTLNAIKSGIANMGLVGIGYSGGAMPMSTIIELPGAFDDLVKAQAAYADLVFNTLTDKEFLPNGVRPIMVSILPQQQLVLRKDQKIDSIADLKGLKIRVPHPTAAQAVTRLGMTPVQIPQTELYLALERGTVDGAINLTASVASYKLQEVSKAVTTNMSLGSIAFIAMINEKDWQKLSPAEQEAVAKAGREAGAASAQVFLKVTAGSEAKLNQVGMRLFEASASLQKEAASALAPMQDEWVAANAAKNSMAGQVAKQLNEALAK